MRLGFDVTPLCSPRTGVGTYTTQLYAHLLPLWEGEVLALAHSRALWANGHRPGIQVNVAPSRPMNKTVWMQVVLPRQLTRAGVDICHFTNSVAPLWSPCPYVVTIHDASLWLYPQYHYSRRLLAMRPFIPLVAKRAAAVIAVSHSAKRDIVRVLSLPPENVHVIYEAPAPHFRPLPYGTWVDEVRARLHLPARFILYVGTIEPRKNLVRLLRAFARLRQERRISHKLLLVGQRGWKEDTIFAAVERLGLTHDVRFLGYLSDDDLVRLYNLADVFVFPSLYEGFGLPVVEAMACGTPVVTSNRGALAEVAGDAAELVDPEDEESIAEGIYRVVQEPGRAAALRDRGLRRVQRFRWEQAAAETISLYR